MCYPEQMFNKQKNKYMITIFKEHCQRIREIQSMLAQDQSLVEIWEHSWTDICNTDPCVKEFLKKEDIREPLTPRDALYGGRTEAFCLHKSVSSPFQIKYVDVVSLYPYVQKYGLYPLGHHIIITENINYDEGFRGKPYFGIAKCVILPPRGLLIPVLPARINKKLHFSCCRLCSEHNQGSICNHEDQDRAFEGTWCTPEIDKALQKGYKLVRVYEVWHYEKTAVYNPQIKQGGLFTSYINQAIKEKQPASGFPTSVKTENEKQEYIR